MKGKTGRQYHAAPRGVSKTSNSARTCSIREDLSLQNQQLREDMRNSGPTKQNEQLHDRLGNFMLTSIISVMLSAASSTGRERKEARTERSELADIRAVLHALAQRDENVAAALKQFNL